MNPRDHNQVAAERVTEMLEGGLIPDLRLEATTGGAIDLRDAARATLVLYIYPRTGVPGGPLPPGWGEIPGARGCTAENRVFRDLERELSLEGATVMGLSAQPLSEQLEFADREQIPYPLLNDSALVLADELGLPTFAVADVTLYKRLTLIAVQGRIVKVFCGLASELHPVAALDWLRDKERRRQ